VNRRTSVWPRHRRGTAGRTCLAALGLLLGGVASAAFADDATPTGVGRRGSIAPLPCGITSFGAAIVDDALYTYGGHKGRAHHYYRSGQVNELWKLNLAQQESWQVVARGPHLQGLAMVAHAGKLYRLGGFTAHNAEDEDHDLRSVSDVACYDPATNTWQDVTPLPEPRSSHDAVVIGDRVYVVGGWQLCGDADSPEWSRQAWVADLSRCPIEWKALPSPPFQRRALSLGAIRGRLYVIGGMQATGGPTTRVDVYDPETQTWTQGPSLIDPDTNSNAREGMEGFGSSAFAVGNRLFVSTYSGNLQCLEPDAERWGLVARLREDRFFHRMLPYRGQLLLVGGASMQEGKRLRIEPVDVLNSAHGHGSGEEAHAGHPPCPASE
jgi:hypothetical protein